MTGVQTCALPIFVGQIVLVGERLELPFLDETAISGLLDEALGRRQIVQVRISQWNLPLSVGGTAPFAGPEAPARGVARDLPVGPCSLYIERDSAPVHSQTAHFAIS